MLQQISELSTTLRAAEDNGFADGVALVRLHLVDLRHALASAPAQQLSSHHRQLLARKLTGLRQFWEESQQRFGLQRPIASQQSPQTSPRTLTATSLEPLAPAAVPDFPQTALLSLPLSPRQSTAKAAGSKAAATAAFSADLHRWQAMADFDPIEVCELLGAREATPRSDVTAAHMLLAAMFQKRMVKPDDELIFSREALMSLVHRLPGMSDKALRVTTALLQNEIAGGIVGRWRSAHEIVDRLQSLGQEVAGSLYVLAGIDEIATPLSDSNVDELRGMIWHLARIQTDESMMPWMGPFVSCVKRLAPADASLPGAGALLGALLAQPARGRTQDMHRLLTLQALDLSDAAPTLRALSALPKSTWKAAWRHARLYENHVRMNLTHSHYVRMVEQTGWPNYRTNLLDERLAYIDLFQQGYESALSLDDAAMLAAAQHTAPLGGLRRVLDQVLHRLVAPRRA